MMSASTVCACAVRALGLDRLGGEEARSARPKLTIGREDVLRQKSLSRWHAAAADLWTSPTSCLLDDRAVHALNKGVVVRRVRARALARTRRCPRLRAARRRCAGQYSEHVVGVKAAEGEGEGSEQGAEDRHQARGLRRARSMAMSWNCVTYIEQDHVVPTLQVIRIDIVDGIDPDISRGATNGVGRRRSPTATWIQARPGATLWYLPRR